MKISQRDHELINLVRVIIVVVNAVAFGLAIVGTVSATAAISVVVGSLAVANGAIGRLSGLSSSPEPVVNVANDNVSVNSDADAQEA